MRQLPVLLVAFAFVGCAALVTGPSSGSVSRADAEQLQQLATANPKIHFKRILYIHAVRPDRVYVEASDSILDSFIRCTFTARKRAGRWTIDENSISNYDEVILTS
jgi:hypothetical protein